MTQDTAQQKADATICDEVMAHCLIDAEYAAEALALLPVDAMPSEAHKFVLEVMRDGWEEHREVPSAAVIFEEAKSLLKGPEKRAAVKLLWNRLEAMKVRAPRTALDHVKRFAKQQGAILKWKEAGRALEQGKLEEADAIFQTGLEAYDQMDDYVLGKWLAAFEARQEIRKREADDPDQSQYVKSGYRGLDALINGGLGLRRGQGGGILAVTNVGKTALAINFGYNGVTQDLRGVHISTEMDHMSVSTRYDVRFAGIASDHFLKYGFTEDEIAFLKSLVEEFREKHPHDIAIIEMPLDDCTRSKVERSLKHAERELGGLDFIIFDSCDHVKSGRRGQGTGKDAYRLEQAGNYWWFKGVLQRFNAVGWTTIQAGSQAAGGRATNEDVSEAYDKARHLDVLVSLNRQSKKSRSTPKDEVSEKDYAPDAEIFVANSGLYMHLAKNRHGPALLDIPLEAYLHKMLICDASNPDDDWARKGPIKE